MGKGILMMLQSDVKKAKMNIEIHIERLILEGFAARDRYAIGDAVSAEITRILMEQGIPASWQQDISIPRLDAGSFTMSKSNAVNTVGNQIAQAVVGVANNQ